MSVFFFPRVDGAMEHPRPYKAKHWAEEEERTLLCIVQEKNPLAAIDGRRNKNAQVSRSIKHYLVY